MQKRSKDGIDLFRYRTDSENVITWLNEAFIIFARENWRPDFAPDDLLGKELIRNFSDPSTRHLYSAILSRLRENPRPITLPFRCDSPSLKRYMELTITPSVDKSVEWNSRILKEEPREPVALLDAGLDRCKQLLTVCSWCKRSAVPDWLAGVEGAPPEGTWIELEEMMRLLGNLESVGLPLVTHTACPDCFEKVLAEIEKNF